MKFPDTDDLVLFGALAAVAIGAALVTAATTSDNLLTIGVALIVFGLPSFLLSFMAAGEPK